MKTISLLIGTALTCGTLAAPAFAATAHPIADSLAHASVVRIDPPQVMRVVAPTDLSSRYYGAEVTLRLTVNAAGEPRDITVDAPRDPALVRALTKAVAQWRFAPARKDGLPISTKVVLPIRLS
jgi:TonB family protein